MSDKPDKDQKTEKPTPRRKKEARKQGQIAKSPEVSGWLIILASTFLLPVTMGKVTEATEEVMRRFQGLGRSPDPRQAVDILGIGLTGAFSAILPLIGFCAILGLVTTLAQVGFVFTGKSLAPKAERINPFAGIKRLFSAKALWETLKSSAKFAVIAAVAVPSVMGVARDLVGGPQFELSVALSYAGEQVVALVRLVSSIALIIAAADYLYQRRSISKQLMMTKAELKQEMKSSEGDPMVKGKIRQLQRAASRNRMLASIPDANVVIMNPTHFAVALRYRPQEGAPRVVAKGKDNLAFKIRERAQAAGVPVVEAPPLARALHKACDIDQEIPFRLFDGVAKVLAFVHRLNGRSSLTGTFILNDIQVDEDAA